MARARSFIQVKDGAPLTIKRAIALFAATLLFWTGNIQGATAEAGSDCNRSATNIIEQNRDAIVSITVVSVDPFDPINKVSVSKSTAFLIDDSGNLATTFHSLLNQQAIFVEIGGKALGKADFVAGDAPLDLGIIRAPALAGRTGLEFGQSDELKSGTQIFILGHPLGQKLSIASGIVSAVDVPLSRSSALLTDHLIQLDATSLPGGSGSPVLDGCGRVAGVLLMTAAGGVTGLALPAATAKPALQEMLQRKRIVRPWLGVVGRFITEAIRSYIRTPIVRGFLVETLEPGSDLARAGLAGGSEPLGLAPEGFILFGGDIITKVNGVEINDDGKFEKIAGSLKAGDEVAVEYFRGGIAKTAKLRLTVRPIIEDDLRVLYRRIPDRGYPKPGGVTQP